MTAELQPEPRGNPLRVAKARRVAETLNCSRTPEAFNRAYPAFRFRFQIRQRLAVFVSDLVEFWPVW